jgi:hypothetical protein
MTTMRLPPAHLAVTDTKSLDNSKWCNFLYIKVYLFLLMASSAVTLLIYSQFTRSSARRSSSFTARQRACGPRRLTVRVAQALARVHAARETYSWRVVRSALPQPASFHTDQEDFELHERWKPTAKIANH